MVGVVADPGADRVALERWFAAQPSIVEAMHLTGPDDYVLRVRCRTTADLDEMLMTMKAEAGAASTHTRVVLRAIDLT